MELTTETIRRIEALLQRLEELDPADLPEPVAELAAILGGLLENTETDS